MRKTLSVAVLIATTALGVICLFYGLLWVQGKEGGSLLEGAALFVLALVFVTSGRRLVAAITPGWPKVLFG